MVKGHLTGCSIFFLSFLIGQSVSPLGLLLLKKTIFALASYLFVVLLLDIIVEQWQRSGGLHQV